MCIIVRDESRPHSRAAMNRDNLCAICLDEYKKDPCEEKIGLLNHCGHFYHFDCIWPWLQQHQHCPVCRQDTSIQEGNIQAVCFAEILTNKSLTVKTSEQSVEQDHPTNVWVDPAIDLPGSILDSSHVVNHPRTASGVQSLPGMFYI